MSKLAYDIESAAEAASVSPSTIRGWIASGDLIAHSLTKKAGSKVLIYRDDLVDCIQALPLRRAS